MTLILSNDDVASLLTIEDCLTELEAAYRDMVLDRALSRPRSDIYMPGQLPDSQYIFKSMEGAYPSGGVVALRLNSDTIVWSEYAGGVRKDKQPVADGKWVGLVLLFSTASGEPLAIFPDGVMQRLRVGATNALGVRYLARPDAATYALLGSGWQAGAQLMAVAAVRRLREVRVFSPDPEHRARFADEHGERLGLSVRPAASAREAVEGADIVGTATNSVSPVLEADWLESGTHVTCVKRSELGPAVLARCDVVAVHARQGLPHNYLVGLGDQMVPAHDPLGLLRKLQTGHGIESADLETEAERAREDPNEPILADIIAGKARGRTDPMQITAFVNNIGLGLQFAALGKVLLERARAQGVGREIPTDWFLETPHP